jgi:hypothetical protein
MPGNLSGTFHHNPLGESTRSSNLSKGHFTVLVKTNYQELHFSDDPLGPILQGRQSQGPQAHDGAQRGQ